MGSIFWITIGFTALLVIVGIIVLWLTWDRKRKGIIQEPNYRVFFIMGMFMTPVGMTGITAFFLADISFFIGLPFFFIGLVYIAIGLSYRNKWKRNQVE